MARFKNAIEKYNYYAGKINEDLKTLAKEAPESKALERYAGEFEPITSEHANIRKAREMAKRAEKLYKSGATSLEGSERSMALTIDKLREEGLDFIDRRNFRSFMRFLHDAQARGLGSLYTSEQIIEAVKDARRKGLNRRQIEANIQYWEQKMVKYDKEGLLIEPDEYKPLKPITGQRLENFRKKARARARAEAKGGRR
jgi:hypothetical protein